MFRTSTRQIKLKYLKVCLITNRSILTNRAMSSKAIKNWFRTHKEIALFLLLFWASVGTWEYTDSVAIELTFMVPYLPESWALGSVYGLISGLSNVALLSVPLLLKFGVKKSLIITYSLGLLFSILLILSWNKTVTLKQNIFEGEISIGFFFISFILLGLDGVRGTLLFAWTERDFPADFVTAILVGEVSGGFLAVLMSYLQGYRVIFEGSTVYGRRMLATNLGPITQGTEYQANSGTLASPQFLFGPSVAFVLLCTLFATALFAFAIFMYLDLSIFKLSQDETAKSEKLKLTDAQSIRSQSELLPTSTKELSNHKRNNTSLSQDDQNQRWRKNCMLLFTFITGGMVFTFAPAFISYTSLPYSQRCYTSAVSCWGFWLPMSGIIAHYKPIQRIITFWLTITFHIFVCSILFSVSLMSPNPPFLGYLLPEFGIIALWSIQALSGYLTLSSAVHSLRSINIDGAVVLGVIFHNLGEFFIGIACFVLIACTNLFQSS